MTRLPAACGRLGDSCRLAVLAAFWIAATVVAPARADVLQLEDGSTVRGKIVREEVGGPLQVLGPDGTLQTFARARVRAIVRDEPEGTHLRLARYDESWSRLEVAWVTLVHPETGRQITLAGAVHIADPAFYRTLQQRLDRHDLVLYEGVGADSSEDLRHLQLPHEEERARELRENPAGSPLPPSPLGATDPLTALQTLMGQSLDLTFQNDALVYERSWWKPADVGVEELKQLVAERFGPLALLRAAADREAEQAVRRTVAIALRDAAASVVTGKPFKVILKESFARLLVAQMGAGDDNGTAVQKLGPLQQALIIERNQRAIEKLEEALEVEGARRIAILYGAGHMADLEARLARKGFRRAAVEWLPAWEIRWQPRSIWERLEGGR